MLALVPALFLVAGSAAADGLDAKLDEMFDRYENGSDASKAFEIAEDEANAYIREERGGELPEGIENPWVKFEESVAIVGATLDLDKLELPPSAMLSLLSGRVPVEVTARINAGAGVGQLVLERITLSGVTGASSCTKVGS